MQCCLQKKKTNFKIIICDKTKKLFISVRINTNIYHIQTLLMLVNEKKVNTVTLFAKITNPSSYILVKTCPVQQLMQN